MKSADADEALDDHEPVVALDRQPVRDQRRRDLEEQEREADRDREGEDELAARELGLDVLAVLALLLRRVVRRDGERAEADRERLAERDDAADDRDARTHWWRSENATDRPVDLGDLAVGLADGDATRRTGCASSRPRARPGRRSAQAVGDRADRRRPPSVVIGLSLAERSAQRAAARRARAGAGTARRGRRCRSSFCLPV